MQTANRNPRRVVIVDRYAAASAALQAVLDGAGHFTVVGVFNESNAATVDALVALSPSIALVDVTADGVGLLRRLRPRLPAANIIAMTTRPTPEGEAAVLRAGADGYLEKSLDAARLVRALTVLDSQRRAARSS
jgi:DNA-binding NarL/FixJ family response regulator